LQLFFGNIEFHVSFRGCLEFNEVQELLGARSRSSRRQSQSHDLLTETSVL
jgi:hypothetical protein